MGGRHEDLGRTYARVGQELAERAGGAGDPGDPGNEATCLGCGSATLRVGTDVQDVGAVADAVRSHGERYLGRVYAPQEVLDCLDGSATWTPGALASLAARYAAKESVVKVLRPVQTGVPWTDVEVVRQPGGWCTLALHGDARRRSERAGLSSWVVSFAHDGDVAVATVIARHVCAS